MSYISFTLVGLSIVLILSLSCVNLGAPKTASALTPQGQINISNKSISIGFDDNATRYVNKTLGFSIYYPSDWNVISRSNVVSFISPIENTVDTYREPATVVFKKIINSNITLDRYALLETDYLNKKLGDFDLITSLSTKVADQNATRLIYTYKSVDRVMNKVNDLIGTKILMVNGDRIISITYTTELGKYSKYFPIIKDMTNSFMFLK
jgi:hypothetical protein